VAVFEDPNCPHCRTTRAALNQIKDATVYTFTYPILAADSEQKVKMALCAKDKLKAWNSLVMDRALPDNDGKCKNDLAKIVELGRKLGVTGTPTLMFTDGKRVPNGVSLESLNRLLDTHSKV
jgi:thiol:disulfide interchange protein DsbC